VTAPVVDLKRNSLDDGPGVRTVVFFKGCPLDCVWCQNPETKSAVQQIVYEPADCVGCGACARACGAARGDSAILVKPDRQYPVDKTRCLLCGACVDACPAGALRFAAVSFSADELLRKLLVDEVFYRNTGGGVTLSGGEPTLHMAFAAQLCRGLKERGIHVCLETCGMYDGEEFRRELLPYVDLVYFDVKLFDRAWHEKYCGLPNDVILENLCFLLDAARDKVLPRIPLIPGITTDRENLTAIRRFLLDRGAIRIGLIPYNPLWLSKERNIGMEPAYTRADWLSPGEKQEIREALDGLSFRGF
jgi:pyruvate formate lyase activating enzyme